MVACRPSLAQAPLLDQAMVSHTKHYALESVSVTKRPPKTNNPRPKPEPKAQLLLGSLASPNRPSQPSKLPTQPRPGLGRRDWRRCILHRNWWWPTGRFFPVPNLGAAIVNVQVAQPKRRMVVHVAAHPMQPSSPLLDRPELLQQLSPADDAVLSPLQPIGTVKARGARSRRVPGQRVSVFRACP